ncbi:hypothetical protein HMI56_004995, partial [Coelomomyces lativittatus]
TDEILKSDLSSIFKKKKKKKRKRKRKTTPTTTAHPKLKTIQRKKLKPQQPSKPHSARTSHSSLAETVIISEEEEEEEMNGVQEHVDVEVQEDTEKETSINVKEDIKVPNVSSSSFQHDFSKEDALLPSSSLSIPSHTSPPCSSSSSLPPSLKLSPTSLSRPFQTPPLSSTLTSMHPNLPTTVPPCEFQVPAYHPPTIVILDSLQIPRPQSIHRIEKYIDLEIQTHHQRHRTTSLQMYSLPHVLKQPNTYDCGIYMLHFVEQILKHWDTLIPYLVHPSPSLLSSSSSLSSGSSLHEKKKLKKTMQKQPLSTPVLPATLQETTPTPTTSSSEVLSLLDLWEEHRVFHKRKEIMQVALNMAQQWQTTNSWSKKKGPMEIELKKNPLHVTHHHVLPPPPTSITTSASPTPTTLTHPPRHTLQAPAQGHESVHENEKKTTDLENVEEEPESVEEEEDQGRKK